MKIYDVTVPISAQTPIYEGDPPIEFSVTASLEKGDAANVSHLCCGAHTGTHVDAPAHFIAGGKKVHEIELKKLIGAARVVGLNENVTAIEPKHFGHLESVERVLFKTRNSEFWNEPEKGFRRDFTYITPEAARALVEKNIVLVGIDYLSVERFGAESFDTHLTLLENEVVILEGLDLREIAAGDYEMFCLPLAYIGAAGDGAPARTILRAK